LGIVLLTGIMSAALGCGPKLENKANFQAKPGEPAATTETGGKLAGPKQ
jgi:hypothetical protein